MDKKKTTPHNEAAQPSSCQYNTGDQNLYCSDDVADIVRKLFEAMRCAVFVTTDTAEDRQALQAFDDAYCLFIREIDNYTPGATFEREFKALARLGLDVLERIDRKTIELMGVWK